MVGDGGGSTTFTGNFRLPISTSFQGQSFSLASFVNGVEIPVMSIEMTHGGGSTTFTGNFRLPISTSFQGQSFSLASFVNGVEIPVMSIEMTQLPT